MVTPRADDADNVGASLTGFASRLYDEVDAAPGWTTYWELTWEPLPGAIEYLVYYATAEGMSRRPRPTSQPSFRLSVARGQGTTANVTERAAQLALQAAQLRLVVVARLADGSITGPSRLFPVGEAAGQG